MTGTTIVLLHGAGMDAWIWDRVRPLIEAETMALDVPSRSTNVTPADCAARIVSAIDARASDGIILVMHSLAGVLAAALAGLLGGRLKACVYVSAVIPGEGGTFAKAMGFPGRLLLPVLFRLHPRGLIPSESMIRAELCEDLGEDDSGRVVKHYKAEFPGLYLSKVAAPPTCRSVYIKLTADNCVSPKLQSRMLERLKNPEVSEIHSGHLAMLSHAKEIAAIINRVAA